jgi:glutamine amidotransferase
MNVMIVDYGSGNLHSAQKAFERAAQIADVKAHIHLTANPHDILTADRIILPGVGAFADCKKGLNAINGMIEALEQRVLRQAVPFLGICVGMQLLASRGLEHGEHTGLNWIEGDVAALQPSDHTLKIPHMGWNTLLPLVDHKIFRGIRTGDNGLHAYFVHSYAFKPKNNTHIAATTEYGGPFVSVIARDNIIGTQFHPEKSQALGLQLLANFLRWAP